MNEYVNVFPPRVVIFGGTGAAIEARPIIEACASTVVAIFDHTPGLKPPFPDVPLYEGGFDRFMEWLGDHSDDKNVGACIAIGNPHGRARIHLHNQLTLAGIEPVTIAHPSAILSRDAEIGRGSQILAGTIIEPQAWIGQQCIVNAGAILTHGVFMADGAEVGPGAVICGDVYIGACTWIGAGATVLPRLTIGNYAIVGAGAVVTRDVPVGVVVVGNPARILRKE